MIRVLLADDHKMFRQGVRIILRQVDDIEVVGEASDGDEVLELVHALKPDVVVMDVHMKRMNGIRTTQILAALPSPPAVIILTMAYQADYLFSAIRAGAKGYYLKESDADTLISGIRHAAAGVLMLDSALGEQVIQSFQKEVTGSPPDGLSELSEREREIIRLVASGSSNATVAEQLGLSEKTIKNHLSMIFRKLELENRTQAAIFALRHGLITLDELDV